MRGRELEMGRDCGTRDEIGEGSMIGRDRSLGEGTGWAGA